MPKELNEPVLEDNYMVYMDYYYVADGNVIQSPVGGNVARLKAAGPYKEIRRCDIVGRANQESAREDR